MAEHVTSRKTYFAIFAALLILTYATIVVARIDLGRFNTIVALTIAVTKAVLVVVGGFMWLALLIGLTMADIVTRGWIPVPGILIQARLLLL